MYSIEKKVAADYWERKLKGATAYNLFPDSHIKNYSLCLEEEKTEYFSKLTGGSAAAEYVVFLTIFNTLIQRYFGSYLIFSRNTVQYKNVPNGVPLLYKIGPIAGYTLKDIVLNIKEEVQQVYKYAHYDKELVQKKVGKNLFSEFTPYGFLYNDSGNNGVDSSPPFLLEVSKEQHGNFKLEVTFSEFVVEEQIATHFCNSFKTWIEDLEKNINRTAFSVPLVSVEEKERLIVDFNNFAIARPKDKTIIDLFEEQVGKSPDDTAVVFEEKEFSYQYINEIANQLARFLRENYDIKPNTLIGVKLERNEQLIISILAILKAGAAYVPIDTSYPNDRIRYIEKDCNCTVVIEQELLKRFSDKQGMFSNQNLGLNLRAKDLAYIIYTSGTTGNPKGIMIMHANAVELIFWAKQEFHKSRFDILYAPTSHCFDLSVFEMFYPLVVGSKLRLLRNALEIKKYLGNDQDVFLNTVPSVVQKLLEEAGSALENVTVLNLAGEPFPKDIIEKLSLDEIEVRNLYGPSEDTTYSTSYLVKSSGNVKIPIGKPNANTKIYILDENLELLPIGVTGKLFIAGAGVAKGYLNRPELTNEKFINNPFVEGEKMYDTGDLARWLLDGNIEFLGRKDNLVKLRGYRIELGEIESSVLKFSASIKQVVVEIKVTDGEQGLVCYLVSTVQVDKSALRDFLFNWLPAYMVPSHFVELKAVPLTLNGKVDRKALPEVGEQDIIKREYTPPRTKLEKELVKIWEEVIGVEKVGIKDHFFELGGHSLMIAQIINKAYKRMGKSISFKMFYSSPTIETICNKLGDTPFISINKAESSDSYPVTPSQHRLWLLSQLEGGSQAHQIAGAIELTGNVNVTKLKAAFINVLNRHDILKTSFNIDKDGALRQYILRDSEAKFDFHIKDFSEQKEPHQRISEFLDGQNQVAYDLSQAPLFKAFLFKVDDNQYVLYLSLHHIISDGWSLEVLTSEVLKCYAQLQAGEKPSLPDLPLQFKDYAVWLNNGGNEASYSRSKEYWLNEFKGELPTLQIPGFKRRPNHKTYSGNLLSYTFSTEVLSQLKRFSQKHQATLFMTLMSGVKVILSRYSLQDDIIVGTPIAGRDHPDLEGQIGLYLNTLAIRTKLNEKDLFLDVLQKEKKQLLDAYMHQDFPFDSLVELLKLKRDSSRSPLFDVMVVLQNQQQLSSFYGKDYTSGFTINEFKIPKRTSQFDFAFTFAEKDGLTLDIEYNTDIYTEDFIKPIFFHLENLFNQVVKNPEIRLEEIDLLTNNEKQRLIKEFNNNAREYDTQKTILDLFNDKVIKKPDNLAIFTEGKGISYSELDQFSNQLAHHLIQSQQISKEDLVAVKLERNEWLVIALLAVLKSGAAYVPIDPNYPEGRIQYILKDSNAKVIIDDAFLTDFSKKENLSKHPPLVNISGSNLAYVIYTSGSTGKPKGVMIEHSSIVNLCLWHIDTFNVNESSKASLFSGIGFDASVWEIYPYLVAGATLYPIFEEEVRISLNDLRTFFNQNKITHSYLPTTICEEIIEQEIELPNEVILTGGEALTYSKKVAKNIYNNYGPTENTVVTTSFNCKSFQEHNIPIGKPIDNSCVYVLTANNLLQPIGVIGELCVSGNGLSRGYLNRPELTAEAFVSNPFSTGKVMYKTGDLVRWLPDGNIEFIGRKDHQVKIRGNRIELGEIEYVISEYSPSISQALVIVKELKQELILVAYYVASEKVDSVQLRQFLQERLPNYMIPNYYLPLKRLPLTSNGKVDKRKLPDISEADIAKKEFVSPTNETEERVIEIWEKLLGQEKIGITDDFFELGGHSLLLTKLTNEYSRVFGTEINLKHIYANTTLMHHAELLAKATKKPFKKIDKVKNQKYYDLSPSQVRYWLLNKIQGKTKEFNIFSTMKLPHDLKIGAFEDAFNSLLERHEILRTVFLEQKGVPKQKVFSHQHVEIPYFEQKAREEARNRVFCHEFNLDAHPLYRVALCKEEEGYIFFFNIHHIISDGWSIGIIAKELMEIYQAKISNRKPDLPELEVHYKDYSIWQNELLRSGKLKSEEKYWKEKLSGSLPYLQLPLDYVNKVKSAKPSSSYYTTFLDLESKQRIEGLAGKNKVSVFAVFAACLKVLLYRLTSENDIIIGIPAANRNHYQLKDMLGCFLNTLMLRSSVDGRVSFEIFLQEVNLCLMNALVNQNYPFEYVLEQLEIPKDRDRFPISSVFLNMLDFEAKASEKIDDFNSRKGKLEASPKFDFECYIKSFANGYEIKCVYDSELFRSETIQYWMDAFLSILEQVMGNAQQRIDSLKVFDTYLHQEKDLNPINAFERFEESEINQPISRRFEKQVEKFPDKVALSAKERMLTYRELNDQANYLAYRIIDKVGKEEQRVALLLGHDESCVIGMLGVLKAGYAYVPIDINNPLSRIQFLLKDSAAAALICTEETSEKALLLKETMPDLEIIKLSHDPSLKNIPNPLIASDPSEEAYVLYTSGSTGKPKGVLQSQRNVLHYIRIYTNSAHISSWDNLSLFSTYTFDASVKDIFGAILNGGTVCIYNITEQGLNGLTEWLKHHEISIIHMVPTIYRHFVKGLQKGQLVPSVRLVDLGGEPCYKSDFEFFKEHFPENSFLINDYGPTESTIVSQKFLTHNSELTRNNVPIGKAVTSTEVFLLTEENNRAKVYQEGEIVFKSNFLSLGYLNQKDLTEKAFSVDPIQGDGRIYRSGDIGRLLPSGEIEFLQRKDSQVKLNGLRIELSEIEYALEGIKSIKEAVVLLNELNGNKYITAYLRVSDPNLTREEIRTSLRRVIPNYMIPAIFIVMDTFPLTRTGKIDKKALSEPTTADLKNVPYTAPESEIEEILVEIWAEVLQLNSESIGVNDNFFELGGNSLQSVLLINKINQTFNTEYSIENLYETLNIRELGGLLNFSILQSQTLGDTDQEQDCDEIIL